MLRLKNSKQPKGERRVSKFSNITKELMGGEVPTTDDDHLKRAGLLDSSASAKYKDAGEKKATAERKPSKELGANKPKLEKEMVGRCMQRKGAIADEHAHKMLASEAVVSETLRVSGLRFN